jgi:hypothetical protein
MASTSSAALALSHEFLRELSVTPTYQAVLTLTSWRLDKRQLDLRLLARRGGETDLRGVVSSYSYWGKCVLLPLRFARTLLPRATANRR